MKAIRHTGIVVSNLEEALHFYQDLLGLKMVRRLVESGNYIDKISGLKNVKVTTIKFAAEDGNIIELLYFHSHKKKCIQKQDISEKGISHVAFTVENLDAEYKRLSKTGIKFNAPPQLSPDGYANVTFCKDPEGNFIELVEVLK